MNQATGWKTRGREEERCMIIDCRVQYAWTYSFGSRCRVDDDARWQTESREGTISARDIRSRGGVYEFRVGWIRVRPAPVAADRNGIRQGALRLFPSSRFLLLPLACPLLTISLSGEPPRRPLNVNDRSPNDEVPPMHNAPPSSPPLECNRNERTRNLWRSACYLDLFICPSSRFFSSTMYPTMCPRWNFFVVGSSLGWREGCNWRSLFVSYSRKDKTSKNISASVSLNEKGAIIPRISLQANLFPLDFAYTRHSCVVTPFSSTTIKNFEFFSRLKRTFSLSQNNDIWFDVATFLASLTTRRNPMKSLSIQS